MITYQELRKIQAKERENQDLQELGENFIDEIAEYIATKRNALREMKGKDSVFSRDSAGEIEQELRNVMSIISDIYDRRQRKILSQVMISLKTDSLEDTSKMFEFENQIYEKVLSLLKAYRSNFLKKMISSPGTRPQEPKQETPESSPVPKTVAPKQGLVKQPTETIKKPDVKEVLLRTTHDVPSFVWQNGTTYGPFIRGDVVNLPEPVAEILLNTDKAETIEEEQ